DSGRPRRNAAAMGRNPSGDAALRNPITGITPCCARAASGHVAAAPPSSVMNSRRLIQSPRRRGRAGGMSRPRALAVLRLITSSNLVGAWTGSWLGFGHAVAQGAHLAARGGYVVPVE